MRQVILTLSLLSIFRHAYSECSNGYPEDPEVFVTWATLSDTGDTITWKRSCTESLSEGFDAHKESMWFLHGLQSGAVLKGWQLGLDGEIDGLVVPLIRAGFNFGIFQWTSYADERVSIFEAAEDKIYTPYGFGTMRFRTMESNKSRISQRGPLVSICDMFVEQWNLHYAKNISYGSARIVGHSLGSQLAAQASIAIHRSNLSMHRPHRLAMLDPVMSPRKKIYYRQWTRPYCGDTVATNIDCVLGELVAVFGMGIEYYKSSYINTCIFSAVKTKIIRHVAFVEIKPEMWKDQKEGKCTGGLLRSNGEYIDYLKERHSYVIPYYLASMFESPYMCIRAGDSCEPTMSEGVHAGNSAMRIFQLASSRTDSQKCIVQYKDAGSLTATPGDDLYYEVSCDDVQT